jgi:peptidoglycan/xylan/chitin deacetylase (PgdA/CDA1 family)
MRRSADSPPAGRFPWYFISCGLGILTQLIALSFGAPSAAAAESGLCWSPQALYHRPGEQQIHKNVPAAILSPPREDAARLHKAVAIRPGAIRRVQLPPNSRKLIALTFDLCEMPNEVAGYQGEIVDFLRAENVKATFFTGGKWLLTHTERAQQLMSDPLFELGNHSWEHRNLRVASGEVLATEIRAPQVAYRQVRAGLAAHKCTRPNDTVPAYQRSPAQIGLFRFPYGACNEKSLQAVADQGLTAIQWDVAAGDPWPRETAPMMVKEVLGHVRPGSIVIFHANGRGWHTPEALPEIVLKLKARGYEFVTVSELLAAGTPVVESRCYNRRPGDTDRYDMVGRVAKPGANRVNATSAVPDWSGQFEAR